MVLPGHSIFCLGSKFSAINPHWGRSCGLGVRRWSNLMRSTAFRCLVGDTHAFPETTIPPCVAVVKPLASVNTSLAGRYERQLVRILALHKLAGVLPVVDASV